MSINIEDLVDVLENSDSGNSVSQIKKYIKNNEKKESPILPQVPYEPNNSWLFKKPPYWKKKKYNSNKERRIAQKERGKTIDGRWSAYRNGARQRGLVWDLSKEDFKKMWQKPCSYCGSDIETVGIDRIDNEKGYWKDNIVPCCTRCNIMKWTMSQEEFIEHCKKVINNLLSLQG